MTDLEQIRLFNCAVAALAAALLFIRINDTLGQFKLPEKIIRLNIVGVYAIASFGSIEAFYRNAPMGITAWLLMIWNTLMVGALLYLAYRRKKLGLTSTDPL